MDLAKYILCTLLATTFAGLSVWPWLFPFFSRLTDRGWILARYVGLLLGALFSFEFAALSGLSLHGPGRWLSAILLLAVGGLGWRRHGAALLAWLAEHRRRILLWESGFWAVVILGLGVRALAPSIYGEEKFPDFAIFHGLLRWGEIPPPDPWLAGARLNYYYWAHFFYAHLANWVRPPAELGYHLSLALNQAFLLMLFLSGASAWVRRTWLRAGLALLLFFGGNAVWLVRLCGWRDGMSYWWQASRAIPYTINEFPYFSFLLGDLHAHYTSLPLSLCLLLLLALALTSAAAEWREKKVLGFGAALLLGLLSAANPWEIPFFLALLLLCALHLLRAQKRRGGNLTAAQARGILVYGLSWLALVLLPMLPFHWTFESPLSNTPGTPLRLTPWPMYSQTFRFLSHFGPLLLIPLAWLVRRSREILPPRWWRLGWWGLGGATLLLWQRPVVFLLLPLAVLAGGVGWRKRHEEGAQPLVAVALSLAFLMLIGVEPLAINDFYARESMRLNTVFKIHYQIWLFLGVIHLLILGEEEWPRLKAAALLGLLLVGAVYPLAGTWDRVRFNQQPRLNLSLDGWRFLRLSPLAGDVPCVEWLRQHAVRGDSLVEAAGVPFTAFGRFSVFSGMPGYLGWINHQLVWRGVAKLPQLKQRSDAVAALYGARDPIALRAAARAIPARYIALGFLETAQAGADPRLFQEVFPVAFQAPRCWVLNNEAKN